MYSPIYNSKYIPLFIMRTYAHIRPRDPTRTPSPPRAQESTPHPKRPKFKAQKTKAGKMPEFAQPKKPPHKKNELQ